MADKVVPYNIEAEEAVLGSLLIDSDSYYQVCEFLKTDDFYRDKNMWVYEARIQLEDDRVICDQVTLAHQLAKNGKLEAVGGAAYLSHLVANVATSVHIVYYAQILNKLGDFRRLIKIGASISDLGFEQKETAFTEALDLILKTQKKGKDVVDPYDLSEFALGYYDGLANGEITPVQFGIPTLDALGGMMPGELVVVGGETEVGKTTILNQIAAYQNGPVLFCTTEMTRAQWAQREVARRMKIPMGRLNNPRYVAENIVPLMKAIEELKTSNVHTVMGSISTKAIYYAAANLSGCKLIIIDYLQRLKGVRATYESASMVSREIADIAKSLEIPIVLSSQLNRESQIGKDGMLMKRPLLTRLKDSGNIENDADWVIFIEREKGAEPLTPGFLMATLFVEKHRQGGDHKKIRIRFNPFEQRYEEVA